MCVANQEKAVELAKRLILDVIWKTANIEIDGIAFPDAEAIFEGYAPEGMSVNDIVIVNNIKRAWMFLIDNAMYPLDWSYVSEYNQILGEGGIVCAPGTLRQIGVRISGTSWIPELPSVPGVHNCIAEISRIEDPQARAMQTFCDITRGQWFNDGNKRTAIMAANHVLINSGIGVFSIAPSLKQEFMTKLLRYYRTNDSTDLSAWLRERAIGHLPRGLTLAEGKRRTN